MKTVKKILKSLIIITATFLLLTFITTILNYFNLLNYKIINITKIIIPIISAFIGGINIGKNSIKKGWFEGLKLSISLSAILLIITLLLNKYKIEYLIYILIISISGILGSIIGINKK